MRDGSVDAVVCDPPYGLNRLPAKVVTDVIARWVTGDRGFVPGGGSGLNLARWDRFVPPPALWDEVARVLKPGGHVLAFAAPRTQDLMGLSLRLAGFEIRDTILAWVNGSLSDDTEILTNEGWVRYDKANEGQHALAFDIQTGALEWQHIQHVHRYWHDGEMVRLHSDDTDQLLTPNHRVVLDAAHAEPCIPYATHMPDLRNLVLEAERLGEEGQGALLLAPLQGGHEWPDMGDTRAQGPIGVDRRESSIGQGADDWSEQPRMEGRRYRVQEARELCRSAVREGAGVGATNGTQGRLHHGAPATDGRDVRLLADAGGSRPPREPQPEGQQARELGSLAVEPGSQDARVGPDGRGCFLPSTRVEAERVDYAGVVWCITVPHGAFIARRKGLIFATGNSGFPKAQDVSRMIDREDGATRTVTGVDPLRARRLGAQSAEYVTGAGWRAGTRSSELSAPASDRSAPWEGWAAALKPAQEPILMARKPLDGTLAHNVVTHGAGALHVDAVRVARTAGDAESSEYASQAGVNGRWPPNLLIVHHPGCVAGAPCHPGCVLPELEAQSADLRGRGTGARSFPTFHYAAKATAEERSVVDGVAHLSVKPLAVMAWLVDLVAVPGMVVLDPFAGTGPVAESCIDAGVQSISIEAEDTFVPLILERVRRAQARRQKTTPDHGPAHREQTA